MRTQTERLATVGFEPGAAVVAVGCQTILVTGLFRERPSGAWDCWELAERGDTEGRADEDRRTTFPAHVVLQVFWGERETTQAMNEELKTFLAHLHQEDAEKALLAQVADAGQAPTLDS